MGVFDINRGGNGEVGADICDQKEARKGLLTLFVALWGALQDGEPLRGPLKSRRPHQ